jgi:NADP-dependent 3-hydroxy acid dehydrogenase YdfG
MISIQNVDFLNTLDHNIERLPEMVDDKACFEIFVRSYKEVYNASKAATTQFQDKLKKMFSGRDNKLYKAQP